MGIFSLQGNYSPYHNRAEVRFGKGRVQNWTVGQEQIATPGYLWKESKQSFVRSLLTVSSILVRVVTTSGMQTLRFNSKGLKKHISTIRRYRYKV